MSCLLCAGVLDAVTIAEHNLRCASFGERVYYGRVDPRPQYPLVKRNISWVEALGRGSKRFRARAANNER